MTTSLIRLDEVRRRTGWSRSMIYKQFNCGEFPKPIKLGTRAIAWVSDEVDAWIKQRIKDSKKANLHIS